MRLGETQSFASPEEALEHYGNKDDFWGGLTHMEKKFD